jgi:hypothetical protein
MALRLRRGTNAERTAITPEAGELVYATDTKKVYVGDGTTTGGLIVSGQNDIVDDGTPQLGGDLDLNGNNITGTGNINITGTITATGNINLGDGAGSDIIAVGGTIQGALTPDSQLAYNQGSNTARWNTGYYGSLDVLGHVDADSIKADLIGDDSTLAYNQTTKAFTGGTFTGTTFNGTTASFGTVTATSFDGDLTGSVFGDDSTALVDAVNNSMSATTITTRIINSPIGVLETNALGANPARLLFNRDNTGALATNQSIGRLLTQKTIDGVATVVASHSMSEAAYNWIHAPAGTYNYDNYVTFHQSGKVAISMGQANITAEPAAHLEVGGAIKPGVYADNTARDAAITSPVAGMIVFNTTGTKFQGYTGSAWADLN